MQLKFREAYPTRDNLAPDYLPTKWSRFEPSYLAIDRLTAGANATFFVRRLRANLWSATDLRRPFESIGATRKEAADAYLYLAEVSTT